MNNRELPVQLNSFIGREKELAHLRTLILGKQSRENLGGRLVVLVGQEGIGKTRLLLQAANNLKANFKDGVFYVDLAPLAKPALFHRTIAAVLGQREEPKRPAGEIIEEFLQNRQLFLILDHCDHVSSACNELAKLLLRSCPDLTVLVSGRELLEFDDEVIYRLPALTVPATRSLDHAGKLEQYDAVRLFVERASAISLDFKPTEKELRLAAQIACWLGGIPLAIELAAAHIRQMTIEEIGNRLEEMVAKPDNRKCITHSSQHLLRLMVSWSCEILNSDEHAGLRRLAIFADSFTQEAALELLGGKFPLDLREGETSRIGKDFFHGLAAQALITEQYVEGDLRFQLSGVVRQCAQEYLECHGEMDAAHDAYLNYYLLLAEKAEPGSRGKDQQFWLSYIEIELNNFRLALELAIDKQPTIGLRIASALWWFWYIQGHLAEGFEWLERMLVANEQQQTIHRGRALARSSALAWMMEDGITASRLAMSGLALSEALVDRPGVAMARFVQGMLARKSSLDEAKRYLEESLLLFEQIEDKWCAARALFHLGGVAYSQGDCERAIVHYKESAHLCRVIGDLRGEATALNSLGALANLQGDLSQAKTMYQACLQASQQADNLLGIGTALQNLGEVVLGMGDYLEANKFLSESLTLHHKIGNLIGEIRSCIWLGHAALGLEQVDHAADYFSQALTLARKKASGEFEAQALYGLGEVNRVGGDLARANSFYSQALILRRQSGSMSGLACLLEAFVMLGLTDQRPLMAAELLGAATKLRESKWMSTSPSVHEKTERLLKVEKIVLELRRLLGEEGYQDAWQRGREAALDDLLQKLEHYTSSTKEPSSPVELFGPIHTR